MKELKRIESEMFKEFYQGVNGNRIVNCILDDNCVRFVVLEKGSRTISRTIRREYRNDQKERCFRNAVKALNK